MEALAIRDLKNNPSNMTKHLSSGKSVFVTKHGKPIGITMPLNDDIFSIGVKKAVALELYKNELISLGKMAEILEIDKEEAMQLLDTQNISWIDDDIEKIKKESEQWL